MEMAISLMKMEMENDADECGDGNAK